MQRLRVGARPSDSARRLPQWQLPLVLWACAGSPPAMSAADTPETAGPSAPDNETLQPERGQASSSDRQLDEHQDEDDNGGEPLPAAAVDTGAGGAKADVLQVTASGREGAYSFAVRLRSPDTGCDRYANYWEVLTPEGELLYRRILAHSHVDEQPFTRSGGPVAVAGDREVLVRAHMHPDGHGGATLRGSVSAGFEPTTLEPDFAAELTQQPSRPTDCAF